MSGPDGVPVGHIREELSDGDKTIWWERHGTPGLDGIKVEDLPLWGLAELSTAPPGSTVVVVEGEKVADALNERGVLAVGTVTGASGTPSREVLMPLKPYKVWLWPDNDVPGRKHMDRIGARLDGMEIPALLIDWPEAPDKSDAADLLKLGGTVEGIQKLLDAARPFHSEASNGFHLTLLSDLLAEPEESVAWVWDKTLPAGGMSVLAAKPKVGKSTLARNLSLAVARGNVFIGRDTSPGPVVYLALEEKRAEVQGHFRRMGSDGEPIYIHTGVAPEEAVAALRAGITAVGAKLAIVDPLFKLVRIRDGNDYAEVTRVLEPLLSVARDTGCHVMAVHHMGKMQRGEGDQILGSTAILGSVDTALIMRRREDGRTLESMQRYGVDLEPLALSFDEDTGVVGLLGSVAKIDLGRVQEEILEAMGDRELIEPDIRDLVEGRTRLKSDALRALVVDGRLSRSGAGKSGDPYRYRMSVFLSPLYSGDERDKKMESVSVPKEEVPVKVGADTDGGSWGQDSGGADGVLTPPKEPPAYPCNSCGTSAWWQRPDGGWACGTCHPDPNSKAEIKLGTAGGKDSSWVEEAL
jgi:hypothetical protein